jgi:uncharacterized protein YjcR
MQDGKNRDGARIWYISNGVRGFDVNTLPRCCAIAKATGNRCKRPAQKGRRHCGVHNGTVPAGGPKGNKNAYKHGLYTNEAVKESRLARELLREAEDFINQIIHGV